MFEVHSPSTMRPASPPLHPLHGKSGAMPIVAGCLVRARPLPLGKAGSHRDAPAAEPKQMHFEQQQQQQQAGARRHGNLRRVAGLLLTFAVSGGGGQVAPQACLGIG